MKRGAQEEEGEGKGRAVEQGFRACKSVLTSV